MPGIQEIEGYTSLKHSQYCLSASVEVRSRIASVVLPPTGTQRGREDRAG